MKKLQDFEEKTWQFESFAEFRGVIRRVKSPRQIILLLHGLGERGKRIFRKLSSSLPDDALIIAPNGPFPLPRQKENRLSFGHSWYFFDKHEQKYFINQDLAKYWLRDLLKLENPDSLPVTILGFSQGGYLAPLVGKEIPETELVIGLACEFRATLIHEKLPFELIAIHGEQDEVISYRSALDEIDKLKPLGINVTVHSIKNAGHEITGEMAMKVKTILEAHGKRCL